jgi:hypothetical protein
VGDLRRQQVEFSAWEGQLRAFMASVGVTLEHLDTPSGPSKSQPRGRSDGGSSNGGHGGGGGGGDGAGAEAPGGGRGERGSHGNLAGSALDPGSASRPTPGGLGASPFNYSGESDAFATPVQRQRVDVAAWSAALDHLGLVDTPEEH